MKFKVNNHEYFIKWRYIKIELPWKIECIVYDKEHSYDEPLLITTTTLPKTSKFDKNTYRKLSLGRTVKQLFTNRRDRELVWNEYFKESIKRAELPKRFTILDLHEAFNHGLIEGREEVYTELSPLPIDNNEQN